MNEYYSHSNTSNNLFFSMFLNICSILHFTVNKLQLLFHQLHGSLCRNSVKFLTQNLLTGGVKLKHAKSNLCTNMSFPSTLRLKKTDTWDIFKYLEQSWTNINNFWYRESPINMLLLTITTLQYVVKQRTSLGFPLAIRAQAGAR